VAEASTGWPLVLPAVVLRSDDLVRAVTGPDEILSLETALELVVREAPLGIALMDRQLRFVLVNAAMASMNGLPVEDHLGRDVRTVVGQQMGLQGLSEVLQRALDTGKPLRDVTFVTDGAGGQRRTFRCDYFPVLSGEAVVGVCSFVEEVTARRLAESQRDEAAAREHAARLEAEAQVRELTLAREALAEKQAQIQVITDAVPALIALVGKDLRYRFANETYRGWFGRDPASVIGRTLVEVMGPQGYETVREHVEHALGGADVKYEVLMPYPMGVRRVRAQLMPLRTRTGAVDGFVALVQDISAERRREEKLQFLAEASATLTSSLDFEETLRKLAALAVPRLADWCAIEMLTGDDQSEQLAVAHVDEAKVDHAWSLRETYPIDWSQRFGLPEVLRTGRSELYEEIPEELLSRSAVDDAHLGVIRALGLRSAIIAPLIARGRILGAITLVSAESGRKYDAADLTLVEDVAARAALAVENARLYREAREAVRKRDDFLSVASHELKTPLTSLKLTVAALEREAVRAGIPPSFQARLDRIQTQSTRLAALVDQLLDVSRMSMGRLVLEREAVDLRELAAEVVQRFADEASRLGTRVTLTAADPVPIRGDRQRLDQVLTNLVSNALKYGAGSPVDVQVDCNSGSGPTLRVHDGGPGIPSEEQDRIFERFERGRDTEGHVGMGLGLWIVREIVLAHRGQLWVQSPPGLGTTFGVSLPVDG
jgi:PAS domain S-box-containing protein